MFDTMVWEYVVRIPLDIEVDGNPFLIEVSLEEDDVVMVWLFQVSIHKNMVTAGS